MTNGPIRTLMKDPHDSACTVGWDNLTTEEQKEALKLYKKLMKRVNVHYVIRINLKGYPNPPCGGYGAVWPHIIYPLEFATEEDAWDYLTVSPDPALRPEGYKSWSIETVRKPRPQPLPEPKVRKAKLVKEPVCRSTSRSRSKRTRSPG